MWTVAKIKKKEIEIFKKDLIKKTGQGTYQYQKMKNLSKAGKFGD